MGYEALGVEHIAAGGGHAVLRVYIDHPDGITVDDCETVSRQLSGMLDVEDPISGQYDLEVSSPGVDRPLFTIEQMRRHQGQRARIRLDRKLDGRRNFEGEILGVSIDDRWLELALDHAADGTSDGARVQLPLEQIESARLVPDLNFSPAAR
jgi:ribosome maturation factor RimP